MYNLLGLCDALVIKAYCSLPILTSNVVDDIKQKLSEPTSENDFESKVDEIGATGVNLGTKIGVYLAILVVVITGIGLMFASGKDRDDKKTSAIYRIVGIVLVVSAVAIVGIIEIFANSLFTK